MANVIVVSFKEETKAIEALNKIKELDSQGDITLYEFMMIRKSEHNSYDILDDDTDKKGWRTLTGMALGGLVGALAGPAGLIIGLITGATVGTFIEHRYYAFEEGFMKKVHNKANTDVITLIAEVNEDSSLCINSALKPFDAEIFRTEADLEFSDYLEDEIEDLEDLIEGQRKKLKNVTGKEKEKINNNIIDLKAKRKIKITAIKQRGKSTLQEIKNRTKIKISK